MSILNQQNEFQIPKATMRANQVRSNAAQSAQNVIRDWESSFDLIWLSEDPAAVLAELGTDAKEVFDVSSATVELMGKLLPNNLDEEWERVQARLSTIPAYTVAEDGSITLD